MANKTNDTIIDIANGRIVVGDFFKRMLVQADRRASVITKNIAAVILNAFLIFLFIIVFIFRSPINPNNQVEQIKLGE